MAEPGAKRDAFAEMAPAYEDWFETALGAAADARELAALDALIAPLERGRVVEAGAGTGHVARHLAAEGWHVLAIEPSREMLREGVSRQAPERIDWCRGAGEALPLRTESVDGVLYFATLEFVGDTAAALREAWRAARPGGWVAAGVFNALSPWVALYRSLADGGEAPWASARFFTRDEVERLMGMAATSVREAVYFAPGAEPPFGEADEAGKRAGNAPAFQVLFWRKP